MKEVFTTATLTALLIHLQYYIAVIYVNWKYTLNYHNSSTFSSALKSQLHKQYRRYILVSVAYLKAMQVMSRCWGKQEPLRTCPSMPANGFSS
jgi:hypothetical protein